MSLPRVAFASLKDHVKVSAPTDEVLAIKVTEPQATQAEQVANAVASAYVVYVTGPSPTAGAGLAALQTESNQLAKQVADLQSEINAVQARMSGEGVASPAGQADSALISSLSNEQALAVFEAGRGLEQHRQRERRWLRSTARHPEFSSPRHRRPQVPISGW